MKPLPGAASISFVKGIKAFAAQRVKLVFLFHFFHRQKSGKKASPNDGPARPVIRPEFQPK